MQHYGKAESLSPQRLLDYTLFCRNLSNPSHSWKIIQPRHSGVLHRESVFIDISGCLLNYITKQAVSHGVFMSQEFCYSRTDTAKGEKK